MTERRSPTTEQVQAMIDAAGGRANVKSGIVVANAGINSVGFNTPFASAPQVALTVQSDIALRDCLYKVTAVSPTFFNFECDVACTMAWIATDAGDP